MWSRSWAPTRPRYREAGADVTIVAGRGRAPKACVSRASPRSIPGTRACSAISLPSRRAWSVRRLTTRWSSAWSASSGRSWPARDRVVVHNVPGRSSLAHQRGVGVPDGRRRLDREIGADDAPDVVLTEDALGNAHTTPGNDTGPNRPGRLARGPGLRGHARRRRRGRRRRRRPEAVLQTALHRERREILREQTEGEDQRDAADENRPGNARHGREAAAREGADAAARSGADQRLSLSPRRRRRGGRRSLLRHSLRPRGARRDTVPRVGVDRRHRVSPHQAASDADGAFGAGRLERGGGALRRRRSVERS